MLLWATKNSLGYFSIDMKKYKKRYKSIEQINDIFLTNYLFEKRYFSIDTHKTQKIRSLDYIGIGSETHFSKSKSIF
jgi:hypothetical protein